MLRELLERVLKPEHKAAGLFLEEEDDHFLLLKREGRVLAVFSSLGATIEAIQATADKHLKDKRRRNGGEMEVFVHRMPRGFLTCELDDILDLEEHLAGLYGALGPKDEVTVEVMGKWREVCALLSSPTLRGIWRQQRPTSAIMEQRGEEMNTDMRDEIRDQVETFLEIDRLAAAGEYAQALEKARASGIADDLKDRIVRVLESGEEYAIRRVFEEIELRLGQALCESCWR